MAGEGLKQSRDIFPDDYKAGTPKAVPISDVSYNKAMNPPNNPKKDSPPTSYNVNDDYPTYDAPDKGDK